MTQRVVAALLAALFLPALGLAEPVTFDWAYVGNAGNAPDPVTGLGAVPYNYAISKTEVTNAQYAAFLNSVDPEGTNELELYEGRFFSFPNDGIELSDGTTPDAVVGSRYTVVPGFENRPVIHVSLESAMRYANWLHNGQRDGGTETGAYTVDPSGPDRTALGVTRNPGSRFWIPNDDEWYKAAYHDADAGLEGKYFEYANGSDIPPVSDHPDDDPSAANYYENDRIENGFNDGSAILRRPFMGFDDGVFPPYPLSDVGSYFETISPYGTFDQNGNVGEWTETRFYYATTSPWVPSFSSTSYLVSMQTSQYAITMSEFFNADYISLFATTRAMGFRVATIPEPAGSFLLALGLSVAAAGRLSRPR